MLDTILSYLAQASTWRGITAVVSAAGIAISPELAASIATAGVACVGMIEVIRNENAK